MIRIIEFVAFCFVISSTKSEPQLSNILLRPAVNALQTLTGNLFNTENINRPQPAENVRLANIYNQDYYNNRNSVRNPPAEYREQVNYNTNRYRPAPSYQQAPSYPPISNRILEVEEPAQQTVVRSASSACGSYFSYQNEYNVKTGLIRIPNPSFTQNDLKIVLSLPIQLQSSVSFLKSNGRQYHEFINKNYPISFALLMFIILIHKETLRC